jgi:hypothetical protein
MTRARTAGVRALGKVTRPRSVKGKSVKPINFRNPIEQSLLRALHRPAFNRPQHAVPTSSPWSPRFHR